MQSAIPVHERLARNALTVEVSCVNRTRKHVADATRFSARPRDRSDVPHRDGGRANKKRENPYRG